MSTCCYRKHSDMGFKQWAIVATDYRQERALPNKQLLPLKIYRNGITQWAFVATEIRQERVLNNKHLLLQKTFRNGL
jgi:hypothetical protein